MVLPMLPRHQETSVSHVVRWDTTLTIAQRKLKVPEFRTSLLSRTKVIMGNRIMSVARLTLWQLKPPRRLQT
jgi:hypothetical protein